MSAVDVIGYLSIRKAARQLNLNYSEMRQLISLGIIGEPTRDIGGPRKYYSQEDLAEMREKISGMGGK